MERGFGGKKEIREEEIYNPSDLPEEIDKALWEKGYRSVSSRNSIPLEEARAILGLTPEPLIVSPEPNVVIEETKEPSNEDGEAIEGLSLKQPTNLEAEDLVNLDPLSVSGKKKRVRKTKTSPEKKKSENLNDKTEAAKSETENTPESPEDRAILEARNNYLESYRNWQEFTKDKSHRKAEYKEEEGKLSEMTAQAHSDYRATLNKAFNKELSDARAKFMQEFSVVPAADALADTKADLIKKYVVEEADVLEKAKVEGWPPKEKGVFKKAWESYTKLPKVARFAISATLGTAFVATFSTAAIAGATGVLGIGAIKMARSALGYTIGRGASKLTNIFFENARKNDEAKHEKELTSKEGDFFKISNQHQEFLEKQKKIDAWKKREQVALGLVVGVGASNVMAYGENAAEELLGWKEKVPVSGSTADLERITKQKIGPIKPDLGQRVPIPDAEIKYEADPMQAAEIGQPSETSISPEDLAAQAERLTVQKGEGFWQPISREVEFRIKADPEKYGLSPDDLVEDDPDFTRAVVKETNHILRENGIIDANGIEKRFSEAGEIVELNEKGKITLREGAKLYPEDPTKIKVSELGDEPVAVEPRNFPANQNFSGNLPNVETVNPAEATPEISEEPWRTEGLTAHEKFEPLVSRAEDLGNQMDEEFFRNLEKSPLSELNKYENILTGSEAEVTEMEDLAKSLEEDGLEPPELYSEVIDSLKEKLERLAEIKTERAAQFAEFEKSLPPDYVSNANLTLKQYLEVESLRYDIPGQPSSRALEDLLTSANPSPSDMNLKLHEFLESRFDNNGFHATVPEYEVQEITLSPSPEKISLAMKAHAQINLAKAELPEYSENLDFALTAAKESSFAEFQENFVNAPEFKMIKDDLTNLSVATSEKIRILEEAGWKVNPEIKDSISEVIKKAQELDTLTDKHLENWKDWLADAGFEKPEDYIRSIVEAKDNTGQPVTIDTGAVLDMSKNYTPSQMGKFADFVEEVGELAKELSPEELVEARKLPVDQFIKQNIKL
jgi:hypothetical protein